MRHSCDATQTRDRVDVVDRCGAAADVPDAIQPKLQGLGVRGRQEATGSDAGADRRPRRVRRRRE